MFYVNLENHIKRPMMMAVFLFISLLLSACGGGSSSDDGGSGGGTENAAPTVNAGADATIDAGATVELVVDASDADGDIVSRSWHQTSGPSVALTAVDLDAANFTFIAPSTGADATVELVFELTVTDDDGAEARDTVVFTVNRVNQTPVAAAGEDQSIDGLTEVTLSGSGTDSDGTIASYAWEQTAGDDVVLSSADQALATFEAPSTTSVLNLEFTLTVTDSDGETDSDVVAVTVIPENAPLVEITFPPATGVYAEAYASSDATISAFGTMEPKNAADITSVTVTGGVASIDATFNTVDGTWRADAIQIPASVGEFTVQVTVTDSAGLSRTTTTTLKTAGESVGGGEAWDESTAVAVDSEAGTAYVLTTGKYVSDVKLIPIDVATGERGPSITDFSNAEQGVTATIFAHMVFDKAGERFFIASNPADLMPQIIAVDLNTGMRTVVSNELTGGGDPFTNPTGLALGPADTLLVADNGANAVFSVDIEKGDRSAIADAGTSPHKMEVPLHVTWNETGQELFVSTNTSGNTYVLGVDLSVTPAATFVFSANDSDNGPDMYQNSYGLIADSDNSRVFMMNSHQDQVLTIDMTSGDRTLLADDVTGGESFFDSVQHGIAYDSANELLYVVGGEPLDNHGLFVIDAESGDKVLLSRDY
jgi:hypothetical protein